MPWPGFLENYALRLWIKSHPLHKTSYHNYEYKTLQGDGNETIRLLILFPAVSRDDPLVCSLIEHPLSGVRYQALSYVWGDATEKRPVYCAEPSKNQYGALDVSRNLDEALRGLRKKRGLRRIWIDALCINQRNADEKIKQISLMAEIYSRASQSIIWLGDSDENTRELFRIYRMYYYLSKVRLKTVLDKLHRHVRDWNDKDGASRSHTDIALRSHPWFNRIWTLQELLLSSDPLVVCGAHSVPWTHVVQTEWMNEFFSDRGMARRTRCSETFAVLSAATHSDLLGDSGAGVCADFIRFVKQLRATETKDKVIGTASSLAAIGVWLPPVNYAMSVAEIFVAATRAWLRYTNSLELMYLATTGRSTIGLPSWAIDWNHATSKDGHMFHYLDSRPQLLLLDGTTPGGTEHDQQTRSPLDLHLGVRGLILERVSNVVRGTWAIDPDDERHTRYILNTWLLFTLDAQTPPSLPQATQQLATHICNREFVNIQPHMAEVVILNKANRIDRTLASIPYDRYTHSTRVERRCDDYEAYERGSLNSDELDVLRTGNSDYPGQNGDKTNPSLEGLEAHETMRKLEERAQNEALFMTDAGRLGLCFCDNMQDGDVIAFLLGSRCPVVLREAGKAGAYLFVGPAEVYGIMDGDLWLAYIDELQDLVLV